MIIVTGGAGFIGSALVHGLNRRGIADILVVDELGRSDKWKNLRGLRFSDYVEKDDFLTMVVEDDMPDSVQAILHMGACSSTTETDVSYLIKNNFEFTKWLALWAVKAKARFIYASSAATYGDGSLGFDDAHERIAALRPLNPYGYSKQMFDLWAAGHGLLDKVVGLKYFNVFGPNEYHKAEMRSFILKGFEQVRDTGRVRLFKSYNPDYADGEYLRDFLYIKDAVDMTLFFLDRPQVSGIFNVGTGKARSWNVMVRAVFAALGKPPVIEYIDMPASLRDQYQYYTEARIDKLVAAGYTPFVTGLEEAVRDYVQSYLVRAAYLAGA